MELSVARKLLPYHIEDYSACTDCVSDGNYCPSGSVCIRYNNNANDIRCSGQAGIVPPTGIASFAQTTIASSVSRTTTTVAPVITPPPPAVVPVTRYYTLTITYYYIYYYYTTVVNVYITSSTVTRTIAISALATDSAAGYVSLSQLGKAIESSASASALAASPSPLPSSQTATSTTTSSTSTSTPNTSTPNTSTASTSIDTALQGLLSLASEGDALSTTSSTSTPAGAKSTSARTTSTNIVAGGALPTGGGINGSAVTPASGARAVVPGSLGQIVVGMMTAFGALMMAF